MFGFGKKNKKVKKLFSIHSIFGGVADDKKISFEFKNEGIHLVRAYDEVDAISVFLGDYPFITNMLIRSVKEVTPAERK